MKPLNAKKRMTGHRDLKDRMLYPIAVDVRMRPVGVKSRNYDFYYWEGFAKKHEKVVKTTIETLLQAQAGLNLKLVLVREDRPGFIGLSFSGKGSRGEIGNMLTNEFMVWSDLAELPLRHFLEIAARFNIMMGMRNAPPPKIPVGPVPTFDPKALHPELAEALK